MHRRLYEEIKIDSVGEGGDEVFSMEEYGEALIIAKATGDTNDTVTVGNLVGDNEVIEDIDTEDNDRYILALKASDVDSDEDGFEVNCLADAVAIVLRGAARYKAVDLIADEFSEYEA